MADLDGGAPPTTSAARIARGLDLRRNGHGYIGRCPSCGYGGAFTVRDRDGVILVRCHVGCDQPEVIDALRRAGLWGRANGDVRTLALLRLLRSLQPIARRQPPGHTRSGPGLR